MIEHIREYNKQFSFVPAIVNEHLVKKNYKHIILCGMGGSHLAAGILKTLQPGVDIYVHRDYDLPPFEKSFFEDALLVASSYSGNTEEVLSFYKKAKQLFGLPVLSIATGGQLLALAQEYKDPYILLPQTDFVPRTALGITSLALAWLLRDKELFGKISRLNLDTKALEERAIAYVPKFKGKTPVFYSSLTNLSLAHTLKIKCNETAKTQAFCNVFPEANHNELEAYEYADSQTVELPVLLRDSSDDARVQKRFDVFEQILGEKGVAYLSLDISNPDACRKIFDTLVLADFITAFLAKEKGIPQAEVPLIESFKQRLI